MSNKNLEKIKQCVPVLSESNVYFTAKGKFAGHTTGLIPFMKAGISSTEAIKGLIDRYCMLLNSSKYEFVSYDEKRYSIDYGYVDEDNYTVLHKETLTLLT